MLWRSGTEPAMSPRCPTVLTQFSSSSMCQELSRAFVPMTTQEVGGDSYHPHFTAQETKARHGEQSTQVLLRGEASGEGRSPAPETGLLNPTSPPRRERETPPLSHEERVWSQRFLVPGLAPPQSCRLWSGLKELTHVKMLGKLSNAVQIRPSKQGVVASGESILRGDFPFKHGRISLLPQTFLFAPTLKFNFPSQTSSHLRGVKLLNQPQILLSCQQLVLYA